MAAIEQGIITSTTKKRLAELETLKTDLEVKIAKEEIQSQILTREQVEFWLKNMEKLNLANADNRQRIINTFINSIYVHDDKFVVNFNCREESEVIPRDLEGDVSSLTILGEQNWTNTNKHGDTDLFVFYLGRPVFGLVVYL